TWLNRCSFGMAMERATLYAIPGSHACMSAVLMLEHEGVDFRRVDLFTGLHPLLVRAKGFAGHRTPIRQVDGRTHRMLAMLDRGGTVPALLMSGERIQTNHDIARFLDRMSAQPALFPANPDARIEVEAAEAWGDEIFQMAARRIALAAAAHGLDAFHDRGNDGEMLGALPAMLDRIDAWIADGVLGGEQLNVADFMIVPSLALISYRLDLRSGIESRPAGALLERLLPERPAHDRGSR